MAKMLKAKRNKIKSRLMVVYTALFWRKTLPLTLGFRSDLGRGAPSASGGSPYGAGGSSGVKMEYDGLGGGHSGWGSPHGDGGAQGPPMTPTSPTGSALSSP